MSRMSDLDIQRQELEHVLREVPTQEIRDLRDTEEDPIVRYLYEAIIEGREKA